jgi:hypothetical protein
LQREEGAPRNCRGANYAALRGYWLVDRGFAEELQLVGTCPQTVSALIRPPHRRSAKLFSNLGCDVMLVSFRSLAGIDAAFLRVLLVKVHHQPLFVIAGMVPNPRSLKPLVFLTLREVETGGSASSRETVQRRNTGEFRRKVSHGSGCRRGFRSGVMQPRRRTFRAHRCPGRPASSSGTG